MKKLSIASAIIFSVISMSASIDTQISETRQIAPNMANVYLKYSDSGENKEDVENKVNSNEINFLNELKSRNISFTKSNSSLNTSTTNPTKPKGILVTFSTSNNQKKENILNKLQKYKIKNFYESNDKFLFSIELLGENIQSLDVEILKTALSIQKEIPNVFIYSYTILTTPNLLLANYNTQTQFYISTDIQNLTVLNDIASNYNFTVFNIEEINTTLDEKQNQMYTDMLYQSKLQASFIAGLFGENIKNVSKVYESYNYARPILAKTINAPMAEMRMPVIEVKGNDISLNKTLNLSYTTNKDTSKYTNEIILNDSASANILAKSAKLSFTINTKADSLRQANEQNQKELDNLKLILNNLGINAKYKQTNYKNSSINSFPKIGEKYTTTLNVSLDNIQTQKYYSISSYLKSNNIAYSFNNGTLNITLKASDMNENVSKDLVNKLFEKLSSDTNTKFNIVKYSSQTEDILSNQNVVTYIVNNTIEIETKDLYKIGEIIELISILNFNLNKNVEYIYDNNDINQNIYVKIFNTLDNRKKAIQKAINVSKMFVKNVNISGENDSISQFKYIQNNSNKYENINPYDISKIIELVHKNANTISIPQKEITKTLNITYTY